MQVTRLAVAAQAAADPTTLSAARREVTTELLVALLPPRGNRQCQRSEAVQEHLRGQKARPAPHSQ